jgi:integrase
VPGGNHAARTGIGRARTAMWASRLGEGSGTAAALDFLERGLAPLTLSAYGGLWGAFASFCGGAEPKALCALPATEETVSRYIGHLGEKGTVAATSLQPYLSAINSVHLDFGHAEPALGHLIKRVRHGLAESQAEVYKRPQRLQMPASEAEIIMGEGLASNDVDALREAAYVGVAFQFAHRESTAVRVRVGDITWDDDFVTLTERYKKGNSTEVTMRVLQQPRAGVHRALVPLLERLNDLLEPSRTYFFELPGDSTRTWPPTLGDRWLQRALIRWGIRAPTGHTYTSHSLRKGAATAMNSIGVALNKICHYGGWSQTSAAVHDYIDVAFPPSAAAARFFGWMTT